MKKIKKIILGIVIILVVFVLVFLSVINIEGFSGGIQNKKESDISEIKKDQSITFLGDSITNGYIGETKKLSADFQGYRGEVGDLLTDRNVKTTNYSVGGYKVEDILEQFETNVTLNDVNKEILAEDNTGDEDLKKIYKTDYKDDVNIKNSIKNSDAVILTIGANDLIESALTFDENGEMGVDFDGLVGKLKKIRGQKEKLYEEIKDLNPDVQIYDVGMYFAYPHQGDLFMRIVYPVLAYVEGIIFIDDDANGIHNVKIRDNMQSDIKENVDNPDDIHPSIKGHKVIANEVLKELQKYN